MNINPQLPINEATSFLYLISFVSNLFLEVLSVYKGNSSKYADQ